MNISTASLYAKQGYTIYRNPSWLDSDTGEVAQSIYIVYDNVGGMTYMSDAAHWAILSPEDCLADDWEIISNGN
jgi:hypothetical protein